jgi:hypothetical protein
VFIAWYKEELKKSIVTELHNKMVSTEDTKKYLNMKFIEILFSFSFHIYFTTNTKEYTKTPMYKD